MTRYILTDRYTGEIIDTKPLTKSRPRPRTTRRKARRDKVVNHWAFIALASTLGMWIAITK